MGSKLRRLLHFAVAETLYYSGALTLWRFLRKAALRKQETCVLGLHRVLADTERALTDSLDGMVLSDATFVKLLEYLQHRFRVISLEDFLASDETKGGRPKPRCLLTFDDGWGDTYKTAYRWLKKFDMPAVVFLATGSVESKNGFWVERLNGVFKVPALRQRVETSLTEVIGENGTRRSAEDVIERLKHMPMEKRDAILQRVLPSSSDEAASHANGIDSMMTWGQALEMNLDGIEMAGHTVTHPLLPYENDTTAERELRLSKKTIEEKLGSRVCAFAYPNGDWDERIRHLVEQTGYECAFTTEPGWYHQGQDRYTIRRILLHEGNVTGRDGQFSPAMFNLTLAGRV